MIGPRTPPLIKAQIRSPTQRNSIVGSWKYLGVPISRKPLKRRDYSFIEHKMTPIIQNQKWKALSIARRTTLLKSVLTSIPSYCLSCIYVLVAIIKRLEKELGPFIGTIMQIRESYILQHRRRFVCIKIMEDSIQCPFMSNRRHFSVGWQLI